MSGFDVHMAGGIAQLGSAPDFPDTHTVAHTYTQSQRSLRGLRALAHLTTTTTTTTTTVSLSVRRRVFLYYYPKSESTNPELLLTVSKDAEL